MKVFFSFFILLSIPTFLSAASFNCAKAASKNEKAICSNPELSNLDMVLAAIYKETRSTISDAKRLKKEQINWIKSLGTCDGNVDCLISAYKNRMLVLDYLDGQITVLIDPLQERIAQLNEREEILLQRENAFTTELRALNSEIERFEEEKLAYNRSKNVPENAEQSSQVIQKPNTSTSSAGASCFDYNSLTDSQSFASGFSAAACSGYFAATQEILTRKCFPNYKQWEQIYLMSLKKCIVQSGWSPSAELAMFKQNSKLDMIQRWQMPRWYKTEQWRRVNFK